MAKFLLVLLIAIPLLVALALAGFSLIVFFLKRPQWDMVFGFFLFTGIAAFLGRILVAALRTGGEQLSPAFTNFVPRFEISRAQNQKVSLTIIVTTWITLSIAGIGLLEGERAALPIAFAVLGILILGWLVRAGVLALQYRKGLTKKPTV